MSTTPAPVQSASLTTQLSRRRCSSFCVDRFRSSRSVTVGSGGTYLVNDAAFSSEVFFRLCRPLSVFAVGRCGIVRLRCAFLDRQPGQCMRFACLHSALFKAGIVSIPGTTPVASNLLNEFKPEPVDSFKQAYKLLSQRGSNSR